MNSHRIYCFIGFVWEDGWIEANHKWAVATYISLLLIQLGVWNRDFAINPFHLIHTTINTDNMYVAACWCVCKSAIECPHITIFVFELYIWKTRNALPCGWTHSGLRYFKFNDHWHIHAASMEWMVSGRTEEAEDIIKDNRKEPKQL